MEKNKHTTFASVLVVLFSIGLFYFGTDGFTSFTAETARVNDLIQNQPKFPAVTLEDSEGKTYTFKELEGKNVLITFFYSTCATVCIDLETNMASVYEMIPRTYIGTDILFLSVSFDPTRDDPKRLAQYKEYFTNNGKTWRMARVPNQAELDDLLKKFGVIVIPDKVGNFAHNSAFYLVDRQGTLVDVMDYTKVEEAATRIINLLEREGGE